MVSKRRKSKKRSAQNSQPPEVTLFIDRNAGRRMAYALRSAGYKAEHHDDWFEPDAKDEVWLAEAGKRGWIVVTLDERIRYRPLEKAAVQNYKVKMIVPVAGGNLRSEEVVTVVLKGLPKAIRRIEKVGPPIIVRIRRDGSLGVVTLE